jgi:hypothetical protein
MNSNTYLGEKIARQAKRIDKLNREMDRLHAQMDKLMGDGFQIYLDDAIKAGVANYEIKELMSEPLVGSNFSYTSEGDPRDNQG